MRVVFALACLLAVAAAVADVATAAACVSVNGVSATATSGNVGEVEVAGTFLKVLFDVPFATSQAKTWVFARGAACSNTVSDAEKAQVFAWTQGADNTKTVAWLDATAVVAVASDGGRICVTIDNTVAAPVITSVYVSATTDAQFTFTKSTTAPVGVATNVASAAPMDVYYGQDITLTAGTPTPFAANTLLVGETLVAAFANKAFWAGATATQTWKANGVASKAYLVFAAQAADSITQNFLAKQVASSVDVTVNYHHATTNNTLTSVSVNGGAAETKAAMNYTVGGNFTFLLTNAAQGTDYYVVAVKQATTGQKTCVELIGAGMSINATAGTASPVWFAKDVGMYDVYVKSKGLDSAGQPTVACTKQVFGTVNVVPKPMVAPTAAAPTAAAPTAVTPTAAAATTTGTSGASAVRGGLVAAFACVLAGLGLTAAF